MTAQAEAPKAASPLGRRAALPGQHCDIVMKGGITSGIVYPKAVARLAEAYRFKNIGGTSAGAIAAVAAAAAEYGYQAGNAAAFERLARVPGELGERKNGGDSRLLLLFQPQPATRWILSALLAFLRKPERAKALKFAEALWHVCAAFPLRTLAALALGILFIAAPPVFSDTAWWVSALVAIGGVLAFLLVFALIVLWPAAKAADRAIAGNDCGVCTGMEGALGRGHTPLTVWMADIIDELGGHAPDHPDPARRSPVTFGDLWGTRDPAGERRVNLVTMTANLNQGRPYHLPFLDADERRFWFDRRDFARLFPARIVEWLVARPHPALTRRAEQVRKTHPFMHPLPAPADIPILLAARMSLSFPVLLSAVPLYDFRGLERAGERRPVFQKCWFSDGGMCSNLPVHLFDGVLPRWPTFAINLRYFKKGDPALEPRVSLPETNLKGLEEARHAFPPEAPRSFVLGLVNAIKSTMQNWVDNSQIRMPGYRDRVAHIHLDETEGGLNLNMDAALIERVAGYGKEAADRFIAHFAPGARVVTGWDNHRWVRFRSGMAMLEEKLYAATRALVPGTGQPGFDDYEALIARYSARTDCAYRWPNAGTRKAALKVLGELHGLVRQWREAGEALRRTARMRGRNAEIFLANAPRPQGYYRVMPRF